MRLIGFLWELQLHPFTGFERSVTDTGQHGSAKIGLTLPPSPTLDVCFGLA